MNSKRIFILTEGGKNIGVGHVTRCISLSEAFEESGISPEFIVNGDDAIENLLSGKKYRIFDWLKEENRLFNIIKDASVVIIDSYLAGDGLYKKISETIQTPVYIDDNQRIDYPRGVVVNGTIYANELDYPEKEGITYLLGNQYIPIRKEFWNVGEKEIKDSVKNIMITFGGDDARGLTPKIMNALNKAYPQYRKNVVIGGAFQDDNVKKIEAAKDKNTRLFYNLSADEIKEIMLESDIAISASGQTLYELARVGVPTIGICIVDNQLNNLKGWQDAGFTEHAGWWQDSNIADNVIASIKRLENKEIRLQKSLIGRKLVDGRGSLRIIDILLDYEIEVSK